MCRFCEQVAFGHDVPYDPQLGRGQRMPGANMPPDLILTGGPVITMDPARPEAEAVAVREGVIQAVGSAATVLAGRGQMTRVVNLRGQALVPGFIATGQHLPARLDAAGLDRWITARARAGYTSVDVARLGPHWGDYDRLARALNRRHRLRLRGAADEGLCRGGAGAGGLVPDGGNDLIRIDAVVITPEACATKTLARIADLHRAGWAVTLDGTGPQGLARALDLAERMTRNQDPSPQHSLGLILPETVEAEPRNRLKTAGFRLLTPTTETPVQTLANIRADDRAARLDRLSRLTVGAAARIGLAPIAGCLTPGSYADFTMLDRSPLAGDGAPLVTGTWIEGVPVRTGEAAPAPSLAAREDAHVTC